MKGFKVLIVLAATASVIPIAACGSSRISAGAGSGEVNLASVAAGLKYAKCMRSHGVPNFPDLAPTAGPTSIARASTGLRPRSRLPR